MDIYEFSQVLWRRKWILLGGFFLLMVLVALMSLDFSSGVKLKSNPKYQAQVQMAVVPEVFESLSQDLGGNSLSASANMFSSLLTAPQAALEIQLQEQVPVLALEVITSDRDRFFWVNALSTSPDGAVDAALGSFEWLERRISQPLQRASVPTTTEAPQPLLDDEGKFNGSVVLEVDHGLATDTDGLWVVAQSHPDDEFAFRLADAAGDATGEYSSFLTPGEPMTLVLEDAAGSPLDSMSIDLPSLPSNETSEEASAYRLVVGLDSGLVRGAIVDPDGDGIRTVANPQFDENRVHLAWEPAPTAADQAADDQPGEVSILLLTDEPVPVSIGGRRTPLLIIAVTTAGTIALVVVVVIVDSWIQERKRRADGEAGDHAAPVAQPIPMSSQDSPEESRRVGT